MEHVRFGIKLALAFFIFGTLILVAFYFTLSPKIALLAYYYTMLAIIVNWLYAAVLLFTFLRRKISLLTLMKTLGVMSLNIPVGVLYAFAMVTFLSYARITFKNTGESDIDLVNIEGCQHHELHHLKKGNSETVWIKISANCDITIQYKLDGRVKKEKVARYLTPTGGIIETYRLGNDRIISE